MVTNGKIWCQSVRWCVREARGQAEWLQGCRGKTASDHTSSSADASHCCRLVMQCDASDANCAAAELHLLLLKPTHQSWPERAMD